MVHKDLGGGDNLVYAHSCGGGGCCDGDDGGIFQCSCGNAFHYKKLSKVNVLEFCPSLLVRATKGT